MRWGGEYSRDQVGLELVEIDIQGAVESEGGGNRGNDLRDEPVQVGKTGGQDVQVLLADVVDSLVIDLVAEGLGLHTCIYSNTHHERTVGVLQGGVRCQDGVVRLDDRVGKGRRGVHAELKLGLLAIVGREALKDEGTKTRTSSTTERVENEESLQAIAVVREPANLVHDSINLLLADGVVATRICQKRAFSTPHQIRVACNSQLLAASSLPVTSVSGWKRLL